MTYDEFISAFNPEIVGDRMIAAVDGVRHFVGEVVDGVFALTDEGKKLVHGTVEEVKDVLDSDIDVSLVPRRGRRPRAAE